MTARKNSLHCDANGTVIYWQRGPSGWDRSHFLLSTLFGANLFRPDIPVPVPEAFASDT